MCDLVTDEGAGQLLSQGKYVNFYPPTHLHQPASENWKHHAISAESVRKFKTTIPSSSESVRKQARPEGYWIPARYIHPCNCWTAAVSRPKKKNMQIYQTNLRILSHPPSSISKRQKIESHQPTSVRKFQKIENLPTLEVKTLGIFCYICVPTFRIGFICVLWNNHSK